MSESDKKDLTKGEPDEVEHTKGKPFERVHVDDLGEGLAKRIRRVRGEDTEYVRYGALPLRVRRYDRSGRDIDE